jgi:hypothetical protein
VALAAQAIAVPARLIAIVDEADCRRGLARRDRACGGSTVGGMMQRLHASSGRDCGCCA